MLLSILLSYILTTIINAKKTFLIIKDADKNDGKYSIQNRKRYLFFLLIYNSFLINFLTIRRKISLYYHNQLKLIQ